MTKDMISIGRCAEICGLRSNELVLGVSPSKKHERLLANYRFGAHDDEGPHKALVADIRAAVAGGAARHAADLLVALRRLLAMREPVKPRRASAARRLRHCGARAKARQTRAVASCERGAALTPSVGPRLDNVCSLEAFRRARHSGAP